MKYAIVVGLVVGLASGSSFLAVASSTPGQVDVKVLSSDAQRTVIEITVPGLQVEEIQAEGEAYHRLTLPGAGHTRELGKPELPVVARLVAISDQGWPSVSVQVEDPVLFRGIRVYPAQEPLPDLPDQQVDFTIDRKFYSSASSYPENQAWLSPPMIWRDWRVVQLVACPVIYSPAREELTVFKKLVVEVVCSGSGAPNEKRSHRSSCCRYFSSLYRDFIVNYDEVAQGRTIEDGSYLIIAADRYYDTAVPLAEWKNKKGLPTTLVRLSEISPSSDTAEIKAYILNAYENWSPPLAWVLLVGDVTDIPCNYGMIHPYHGTRIPNDQYYARLEGDDIIADIYVGRLSVNDTYECATEVNKIMGYERSPYLDDTTWYKEATLIIGHDPGRPWEWTMRRIREILLSNGYTEVDTLMELYGTNSATNVTACWNEGSGFITYRGHGDQDGWYNVSPPFTISYVQALENGRKLPVLIAPTCNTAWYDWSSDCFVEVVVEEGTPTMDKAGVSMFASTRVSYSFYNDTLAVGCYRGIFEHGKEQFNAATDWGKLYMLTYYPLPDDITEAEFEEFNIFGDPELNMRTGYPRALGVSYEAAIPVGYYEFEVTVESNGIPVESARVCLMDTADLYEIGYTDASGYAMIPIETPAPETVYVTVTASNAIPHEGTCIAISEGPYVTHLRHSVVDSLGNADGNVNPAETISLPVWVKNWGTLTAEEAHGVLRCSDPLVTVVESVAQFGDVAPGDSALSLTPYIVSIGTGCEDGRTVVFELAMSDTSGEEWTSHFTEVVKSLVLSFMVYAVDDAGGNGNGMIEPGETVLLDVTLRNDGMAAGSGVVGVLGTGDSY
ncbi:MAG: C25 family cysteine peptidase, partial [Candidatus Thorarchaeota archaeon]